MDIEAKCFKIDEIIAFCQEKGIAFFDTSTAIRRLQDNASDKFLEVVEPTDIPALLSQLPHLRAIVTTGEKATETICASLGIPTIPKVNTFVAIPEVEAPPYIGRVWGGSCSIASLPPLAPIHCPSTKRSRPIVKCFSKYYNAINHGKQYRFCTVVSPHLFAPADSDSQLRLNRNC